MDQYYGGKAYEDDFEFPIMSLVRKKAEELDISYHDALVLVKPDYVRTCRYGDVEYEEKEISKFDEITKQTIENWDRFIKRKRGQIND